MNIYVSEEIKKAWPGYEFIGKPIVLKNGKKYMKSFFKVFEVTHIYDFENDCHWWSRDDIPLENDPKPR